MKREEGYIRNLRSKYKIITTTDVELAERNIFIFPQERAIHYVDKIEALDILIIDEFYKASRNFDKERSPSLIKAILKMGAKAKQKYFLAPNITHLQENPFTKDMEFYFLNFNTVYLEQHKLYQEIKRDEFLKRSALLNILSEKSKKTLIYAGSYSNIERISNIILDTHAVKKQTIT